MKRKWLAVFLVLTLCLGLYPATAAGKAEFPTPDKITGGVWTTTDWIRGLTKSSMIGWYATADTTKNELLEAAQAYIDALEDTGDFRVLRALELDVGDDSLGVGSWSADLKYTGPEAMDGSLLAKRYDGAWPAYGEYHITVTAIWNKANAGNRKTTLAVTWDTALTPHALADDKKPEPAPTTTPTTAPTVTQSPGAATPTTPAVSTPQPAAAAEVTAVLKIGCSQMAVGKEVLPVDTASDAVTPVAENNRTLVPVSRIVDAFGGKSTWEAGTNLTTYTLGDKSVAHIIGTDTITYDGSTIKMDVASKAMNNRTYVPVRFILEALGLWVGYEPEEQLVVVSTQTQTGGLKTLEASRTLLRAVKGEDWVNEELPPDPAEEQDDGWVFEGSSHQHYQPTFTKQDCLSCKGSGKCSTCNGRGYLWSSASKKYDRNCYKCGTTGRCTTCGGSGKRD